MDSNNKTYKIAIIDADLIYNTKHRFPNLALMKLSGYHKSKNNIVNLKLDYDSLFLFDKVYISKVFLDTIVPQEVLSLENVEYGGTGFFYDKATPLPYTIEHFMPDYDLYNEWVFEKIESGENRKKFEYYLDYSIGFTTRGCIRQCKFCVNKNYTKVYAHSKILEFLDEERPKICLLDDNILAYTNWKNIFDEIIKTNKPFQYKQGLDERLLSKEKIEYIFHKSKWIGDYIFAFDNIDDFEIIEKKLKLIREIYKGKRNIKFYLFCAFNHESIESYDEQFWRTDIIDMFKRIEILMKYGCIPYVMRYKDYKLSPYQRMYTYVAGWCNQPSMFKKKSFIEFANALAKGANNQTTALRAIDAFREVNGDVCDKYFNMKLESLYIN